MRLPSGLNATLVTSPVCPTRFFKEKACLTQRAVTSRFSEGLPVVRVRFRQQLAHPLPVALLPRPPRQVQLDRVVGVLRQPLVPTASRSAFVSSRHWPASPRPWSPVGLALGDRLLLGLAVGRVLRPLRFSLCRIRLGYASNAKYPTRRHPRPAPAAPPPPGRTAPAAASAARPPAPRPPPARARPPATAPARRSGRPSAPSATAWPSAGRSAGSGLRQRRHSATSSASAPQPSSRACASARSAAPARWITSSEDLPPNGGCPVRIAHRMPPSANTSARASAASPRACSGAMYAGVPITVPACVRSSVDSPAARWSVVWFGVRADDR